MYAGLELPWEVAVSMGGNTAARPRGCIAETFCFKDKEEIKEKSQNRLLAVPT